MRLFSKDKDLGKDFKEKISADSDSRADFIRRSRGLVSADLKALVRTMVSEKATYRRMRKRRKIVNYVDLYDLKKHFEGKPAQYDQVYKAGPEFTCTHTGAEMYAIYTFKEDDSHCDLARFNPYVPHSRLTRYSTSAHVSPPSDD